MLNEYDKVGQGSNIEHIRNYTKECFLFASIGRKSSSLLTFQPFKSLKKREE